MESNFLVRFFEGVAKFFYALLPTVLPYSTPLPIAMITAASAQKFFDMNPWIAGVFVFSLEGLGVWSTTTFIDKFVDWTRSRNKKVLYVTVIMGFVVLTYLLILILLNVTLKGDKSAAYKAAVTLVCFLPFIAGILNGIRKVDLGDKDLRALTHAEELAQKEKDRLDRQEIARMRTLAKHGFDPRAQVVATTPPATPDASKERHAGDYKDFVMELLDQNNGNVSLVDITNMVNKHKRVNFVHGSVKGTWLKFVNQWKRDHGVQ